MLAELLVTPDLHRTRINEAEIKDEVEAAEGEDKWRWRERACRSGWAVASNNLKLDGDGEWNGLLGDG